MGGCAGILAHYRRHIRFVSLLLVFGSMNRLLRPDY